MSRYNRLFQHAALITGSHMMRFFAHLLLPLTMSGFLMMISHQIPVTYVIAIGSKGDTVEYAPSKDLLFREFLDEQGEISVDVSHDQGHYNYKPSDLRRNTYGIKRGKQTMSV